MENKAHALAAGMFAILLGLAVLIALFWLGGKREATQSYTVVTQGNVNGLNPQGQVRYRGIRVGKVTDIRLDPDDVRNILIDIEIDARVPVTHGTEAELAYQGVTGIAHVLLEDAGTDPRPLKAFNGKPGRIAMGQSLFQELGDSGRSALNRADEFLTKANALLDDKNRKNFAQLLANLERSTAALNRLLADERLQRLGPAVARVEDAAGNASALFNETRQLIPKIQRVAERVDTMIGNPSTPGAAGAMVRINELSRELTQTSRQLNRVLRMVEQSPQSLIFGAPRPAPGPGEPGFVAPQGGQP